jgi:hypothetical protein
MAYFTVQSQANALSFKNSFFVMSVMIACLSPLPFIMRRPKVTISPAEDHQRDAVPEPRLISNVAQSIGQIELTDHDLDFLKELKIAA